jgi:hypothetical protein
MKLFQIEEPDGSLLEAEGPGAAVGMHVTAGDGAVALALGGNAEILPGADGAARLAREGSLGELLLGLRARAEKNLARPVTHSVIVAEAGDAAAASVLREAAAAAGLAVLRLLDPAAAAALARGASAGDAPVLGAAIQAEDDAAALLPR